MNKLYELKDRLVDELKKYADKDVTSGNLEVVDTLAHATKNVCKIIECCEEDNYSRMNRSKRGRYSNGRYSNEDRYSYHGDMVSELRGLMDEAPNERTRQEFQRFIQKIESM